MSALGPEFGGVGFRITLLLGIGAARMSQSMPSMSGASVCRAVMDVRRRSAALMHLCRSAF